MFLQREKKRENPSARQSGSWNRHRFIVCRGRGHLANRKGSPGGGAEDRRQIGIAVTTRLFVAEPNPGFESLSTPANFRSAAVFSGRFYLAGPGGLFVYSNEGSLLKISHPGTDLPAAPFGQLATATLADSNGPELLIATFGEGVLAFDGRRFR
jgi:hypothetical protein